MYASIAEVTYSFLTVLYILHYEKDYGVQMNKHFSFEHVRTQLQRIADEALLYCTCAHPITKDSGSSTSVLYLCAHNYKG